MKKMLLLLFLSFFTFFSWAQLPQIKQNVSDDWKSYSIVYKTFYPQYDFLIASYIHSGWRIGNFNYITILAKKNKKWEKIILSYPDGKRDQIKLKKVKFNRKKAEQLINDLTAQNFWTLSNDSLNHQELAPKTKAENYAKNDTIFVVANVDKRIRVSDGSAYYFEILQGDRLRFYYSENPETYLQHYPKIKTRAYFIKSKQAFYTALED